MPQLYGRTAALYPSRVSQTVESPRIREPGSGAGGSWKVIVRNDDHNTFDHVARTLARFIPGVTLERGHQIANMVHTAGLALVYCGPPGGGRALLGAAQGRGPDDGAPGAGLTAQPLLALERVVSRGRGRCRGRWP